MNPELLKAFNSFIDEESENNPSLILDSYDGKIDIEWEDDSPVTPYGNLSFFIEYLKVSRLLTVWLVISHLIIPAITPLSLEILLVLHFCQSCAATNVMLI